MQFFHDNGFIYKANVTALKLVRNFIRPGSRIIRRALSVEKSAGLVEKALQESFANA
jgi:hypothetical protein